LHKCLESKKSSQANLVQIRGQKRRMMVYAARNGSPEEARSISLSGVGIRVLVDNKSWGFSSTNRLDQNAVDLTLENGLKLAKASSRLRKRATPYEPCEPVTADFLTPSRKPLDSASIEEFAKIPLEACSGAQDAKGHLAEAKAACLSIEDDKYFVSSEGSCIHQQITRLMLFVDVIAKIGSVICPASENVGHSGGMELFDEALPYSIGKTVAEKANRLLSAKAPPSGHFTVVVHPTLCATLLHEAIGHPLEADLALSGGGFGSQFGKNVSSELVTIFDDGNIAGGLGRFQFDDEGTECKHTILIERGILRSFMHDRTSAALTGVCPTGNAHAWDYSVEPLIRQTNIGLEAGAYSLEEMIEGVKEGLFLDGTFGGQADPSADFTFGFQSANWIRDGKIAEQLRGANVSGNAIGVFKTIDAVGKDVVLRPGACGKYQFAVQGRVVPAIRCRIMVGGTGGT